MILLDENVLNRIFIATCPSCSCYKIHVDIKPRASLAEEHKDGVQLGGGGARYDEEGKPGGGQEGGKYRN